MQPFRALHSSQGAPVHLAKSRKGMVQKRVTAQGWLGSTPEGQRPQTRGLRAGSSLAVASSIPATQLSSPTRLAERVVTPHAPMALGANRVSQAQKGGAPAAAGDLRLGHRAPGRGGRRASIPLPALTTLRSALGAFGLCEFRESQHISTFYSPSVQAMETRLGARQRRRPPTVHRGRTHAPRLQRPVASEDEASACSELRLGCHPETPVIEPCRWTKPAEPLSQGGHDSRSRDGCSAPCQPHPRASNMERSRFAEEDLGPG